LNWGKNCIADVQKLGALPLWETLPQYRTHTQYSGFHFKI